MPGRTITQIVAALCILTAGAMGGLVAPVEARAQVPITTRRATELFSIHDNIWLNLHHFLYVTARARRGLDATRASVTRALDDTIGFGALPIVERTDWNAAVAYYDSTLARRDILFDAGMVAINNQIARLDDVGPVRGSGLEPPLAAILERAAPVYRRLWWPRHEEMNRKWAANMRRLLALYGDSLAARESRAFRTAWAPSAVRVDVTAYANWAGAYTTTDPAHITISSTGEGNQEDEGLETIFHEVLHTMDDTLDARLRAEFRAQGKTPPRDPTHVFIFYTAGAFTRNVLPQHVPYAEKFGLWARVPEFARSLPLLRVSWQAYLDGQLTLDQAVERYVAAF